MPKSLSTDATVEILQRLPLASQLRFRWVCKPWFNFISEIHKIPVILFTRRSRPILYSLDCMGATVNISSISSSSSSLQKYVEMDYPIEPPNGSFTVQVLGSCNGLICIDRRNLIYIWNPSTKACKTLPHEEIEYPGIQSARGDHRTIYGFGCNRTMDEYKLVRIVYFDNMLDPEIKIYTLGTNSWKRIGKEEYISIGQPQFDVQGLHVNGALHWKANLSSSSLLNLLLRTTGIISFDIGDEKFRAVPKPGFIKDENFMSCGELHMLRGCLCIFQSNAFGGSRELWMMKDYGVKASWTKLFKTMDPLLLEWETRLLCLCKNDEILMEKKGTGPTGDLVLYNPRKDEARSLDIDPQVQEWKWFHAEIYIQNHLISLKQQQPSATSMSEEEAATSPINEEEKKF